MSWRTTSTPIIAKVLADTKGQPEPVIRKALKEAYPFGERRMWPYKVWLDEIRRQRYGARKRSGSAEQTILELEGQETFTFGEAA
jgi:hypothetical protein